jgi:hypothetical protein
MSVCTRGVGLGLGLSHMFLLFPLCFTAAFFFSSLHSLFSVTSHDLGYKQWFVACLLSSQFITAYVSFDLVFITTFALVASKVF